MSGRHLSRSDDRHRRRDHSPRHSSSSSSSSHLTRFEDKVASQQKELQTLLIDNQRLGATHVALRQELAHSRDEIDRLKAVASRLKAERDAEVREVFDRKLKFEAEARAVEVMREDLGRVRVDSNTLSVRRREMVLELKKIESEIVEGRLKLQQLPEVRASVEIMRQEVQRGRVAIENEKKIRASNQEHGKVMEKNMITVGREIERLRAALKNADKRAVELNTPGAAGDSGTGYIANYANPELQRSDGCVHPYKIPQSAGTTDPAQFTTGPVPHGPYIEHFNAQPQHQGLHHVNQVNAQRLNFGQVEVINHPQLTYLRQKLSGPLHHANVNSMQQDVKDEHSIVYFLAASTSLNLLFLTLGLHN